MAKIYISADRCMAPHSPIVRTVGLKQRTGYGDRRLYAGLNARWGYRRLRIYLLGRKRAI